MTRSTTSSASLVRTTLAIHSVGHRVARRVWIAVAGAVFLAGCSEDPSPSGTAATVAGQRRERVEVSMPVVRESPEQDVRNSRANLMRVVSGVHDAVSAPFPGTLEIDLPASKAIELTDSSASVFTSAVALTGFPKDRAIPQARLYFEVDFVGPKETFKHGPTLGFAEALTTWTPIDLVRGTDEPVKLRVRGSFIGDDPPKDVAGLRMCWALPDPEVLAASVREPERPNVLVISIDTLRRDHLSCYGYERRTSPHIDELVQAGVLFERAYSPAPWTLPAYGSLFTGLLPADHRAGVVSEREATFGTDAPPSTVTTEHLRADVPTLAETLAKRGYLTAGFVSNPYLGPAAGVARGFQNYTSYQYTSQNGVDLALAWTASRASSRWFVFLHVIDPHMPYAPPRPYDTLFSKTSIDELSSWPPSLGELRAREPDATTKQLCVDYYDGEIAFVDAQIGRLLDGLRETHQLENTIVVLHSDHGEEFWEHGGCDHGHTQYDELLRVPLAIVWPNKLPAQKRVTTRVRTLDVFPTIAELVGAEMPKGIEGRSLVPVVDGRETADREAISEAILHGARETKAAFSGRDKLIATGAATNLLFDLADDPRETKDLSKSAGERVAALRAKLAEHQRAATESARKSAALQLDAGSRNRLGNIGYTPGNDDGRPKKDPKAAPK